MTRLVGVVAFGFLIYFIVKLFKMRKATKSDQTKALKKRYRNGLFISFLIMVIMLGTGGGSEEQTTSKKSGAADTAKIVKKPKYVGKDKYNIAKKENVALIAKKKKLQKQEDKLQSQRDKIDSDEQAAKEKAQEQQATAQKQQEEQAKEAQKQQNQAAAQQKQQASSQTQTKGDMNTSDSGSIVGNVNSHIYHVPGQSGYNMNSSNAVYFHSEQEAINAGYRRSKR